MAVDRPAEKRPRRERGSINPDEIIEGAFALAEQVSIDNLSMPLLGKHLGVGVTSIYWYFRKKDDLLNAMTGKALRQYTFATPWVEADDWRESLSNHARTMREVFRGNPILCDLILLRGALSARALQQGVVQMEQAIASLIEAGLSLQDAFDTYSAVTVHIRGVVVLERLIEKRVLADDEAHPLDVTSAVDPQTTPLLAEMTRTGRRMNAPDDHNFEYGLQCILDRAARLIAESR